MSATTLNGATLRCRSVTGRTADLLDLRDSTVGRGSDIPRAQVPARLPARRRRSLQTSATRRSRSARVPELSITMSAKARRCSRLAWAAIRAVAASGVMPRAATSRPSWSSGGTSTTMTASKPSLPLASASSGMACTTTGPGGGAARTAARSASRIHRRTSGWTIELSLSRSAGSAKTSRPSRSRSSAPSAPSTPGPKAAAMRASPGVPGATTSLAATSASMMTAPRAASRRATSLLPDPIPPVSPTRSIPGPSFTIRSSVSDQRVSSRKIRARQRTGGRPGPRRGAASARGLALAAGQALAQRRQRLVGGERAGRRAAGRGGRRAAGGAGPAPRLAGPAAAAAAAGAALGGAGALAAVRGCLVGLAGLLHLAPVRLDRRPRLGVLPLPLLALHLVAGQPLAGLRVEALGVLVVAVLVVGGGHAVQGRVEVVADRLADRALVGLLQRQADPAPVQVDVDDLDEDLVADLHHLLGDLHVPVGQLGDVHQALDALLDPDERAERHQLGHPARHHLADLVGARELLPRVLLGGLQRQRDPLPLHVHVQHLDRDLLAHLDDLARVVDVLPGQLGDVHQAVHAAEVDERAEVDDRGHRAPADLALLQGVQEGVPDLGLGLLQPGPAGQHHVVAVLVQLDDLGFQFPAHVRLQVADAAHLHQRGRQEAAQPDVQDQAALDDLDHRAGDHAVGFLDLLDRAPGALVLRPLLRQDQAALLVLLLQDKGLDVIADVDHLVRVDVVLDGQLA